MIPIAALTGLLLTLTAAPASLARTAIQAPDAGAARTLNATDTASLHYLKHTGSQLVEEGAAHGTLPGNMYARLTIGATFNATFAIHTRNGTIDGHGSAQPHGTGLQESFSGTITITGGTGRYKHAHGHARLSGTFNRRTYAIMLKTSGSLSY